VKPRNDASDDNRAPEDPPPGDKPDEAPASADDPTAETDVPDDVPELTDDDAREPELATEAPLPPEPEEVPEITEETAETEDTVDISEDTTIRMPLGGANLPEVPLDPIDVERVRFSGEASAAGQLRGNPWLQDLIVAAQARGRTDPVRIRRRLQAQAVRLTEGRAADVWRAARVAAERLDVDVDLEIHQATGAENPAIHLVERPALLELRSRLLTLLDAPSTVAALGHELGHYLAHGPTYPDATLGLVAKSAMDLPDAPDHALRAASTLTLAREITADRFGLLACRDLDAALRLEMAATTGLATQSLTWDASAYLEQCKALMEQALEEGSVSAEHGLRPWALWLFSETATYRAMTGLGPGTRSLSDVDEQIARAIGVVGVAGLLDSAIVPEPMAEIHECALAGAALVALADGELSEEESHAIETVFGTLVGDWQRYLVWDQALESFADTGSVVRAGGTAAQRAMFQVLVHVLAADSEVESREVEMICAIGDALGCGELYRTLLRPVLAILGDEERDLSRITHTIPMPARIAEAETALEVFLRGIQRRGGGEASLRRMLRLLGDREGSQQSLEIVSRLLDRVGLETGAELDDAPLDQPLKLTLTTEAREEAEARAETQRIRLPDPELGDARMRLSKGVARLRESLVSGDGRSPSIRLRQARPGRGFDLHQLESLYVGHGERTVALVTNQEATARLVDGREAGVHPGAAAVSQQLIALSREATARTEQTGARDLYVGHPFLTGTVEGYFVRAPLVLHPYELERSEARGFQLVRRKDEAPIVNLALVRLVFAKKGLAFHEDLAERLDRAAADGADAVRQALADEGLRARMPSDELRAFDAVEEGDKAEQTDRLVAEPCAVLGFFPQSTSDMIADYDDLLAAVADARVPLADRLGAAGPLLPVEVREELCVDEEVADEDAIPIIPVLPTDPSQRRVLQLARTHRLLVVDGPPGTGKSQVIVNLVADALARGQKIAVVCEKRAALDVVAQRLDGLGMRHLLAVVHDVHDDRRALYSQIVERLAEGEHRDDDPVGHERTEDDYRAVIDQLQTQRSALLTSLGEERPSLGQFHLLAASFTTDPVTDLDPSIVNLTPRTLKRLASRAGREALHADLHREGSVWRSPELGPDRPSLADADEARLAEIQDQLRHARGTAMALANLEGQQNVDSASVVGSVDTIRAAVATRKYRGDRARRELFAAWLQRGDDPALEPMVRNLQRAFSRVEEWESVAPRPAAFAIDDETRQALTVVRSWGGSWFRFLSWSWWTARSIVRRVLAVQWPALAASRVNPQLVDRMEARQQASDAYERLQQVLRILDVTPVIDDVGTATVWVERIVETFEASRPVVECEDELRDAGVWPSAERGALSRWDEELEARLALAEAVRLHREAFAPVRAWFPWIDEAPSLEVVARLHEAWALDAPRVVTSDHNLDQATALYPMARTVVQQLADQLGEPEMADESEWTDALEHGWALSCLAQLERRHPELRVLDRTDPSDITRAEAQLRRLVEERGRHCVSRILAAGDRVPLLTEARPEQGRKETPLQKAREQMLREANKRRHILSLRSFVRQFTHHGLMDLLPVWLVSPETVSVLFQAQPIFDLIVMDEASQCTVEKGLPALMRGHRAVIAGDDKQMPPTSFFEGRSGEEEDLGTEEHIEADALTAESLLVLARERCVYEGLRWHYRCLREELIAFSNHAMYGGDLYTIPSTATGRAAPALEWERVDGAVYDHGANALEAERVVDLLSDRLLSDHPPSMGVVTFNIQQRQAILDAIDNRIERDPIFAERYAIAAGHSDLEQRPFVKNLEAVQGDERDVILFSLGHAPVTRKDGETYVPARFGPLGQAGGERRLNVAVSRAKRECIVVASFEPHMLSVGNTKHRGPKLLKQFLQYAWDLNAGRHLQANKTLERVRQGSLTALGPADGPEAVLVEAPPLAAQIASQLDLRGVDYDLDVGTSAFRVPLAIVDPDDAERYRVAVLTEAGEGVGDVLETHLHEPSVLKARGWTVVRVTSRQWDQDPDGVMRRIEAAGA